MIIDLNFQFYYNKIEIFINLYKIITNMDSELYDKQIRTYGLDAINKLHCSSVVIIGLIKGLATEILKNLALSGVQNLFLVTDKLIEESDLSTGYYYTEIGLCTHDVLKKKISELNTSVNIKIISSLEDIEDYDLVIVINKSNEEIRHLNNICHEYNKKFISLQSSNNIGSIFVDNCKSHKSYQEQSSIPDYIHSDIEIISVNSIMGSIVVSETIKLLTNLYEPINQFFSWSDTNFTHSKIPNVEVLIIGAGSIGCELIKNLAFLDVKKITITDSDTIKKSNLSRQFLFRNDTICKLKSEIAVNAIKQMKPDIEINYLS